MVALCYDRVPSEKYGKCKAIISSVFAVASVLGPMLGGATSNHLSWRWVFLLK
jgi:predicted MFS family arabinose efflux permease